MNEDTVGRGSLAPGLPSLPPPGAERTPRRTSRAGMNKTGARILGGFVAAFIAWVIVITEWVLVKEPAGR